jgi:ABC-type dipeptide/oligopeptide/nickel transport system permease subunit
MFAHVLKGLSVACWREPAIVLFLIVLAFPWIDLSLSNEQVVEVSHLTESFVSPRWSNCFGTDELGQPYGWPLFLGTARSLWFAAFVLGFALLKTFFDLFLIWIRPSLKSLIRGHYALIESWPGFIWISIVMMAVSWQWNDRGRLFFLGVLLSINLSPRLFRLGHAFMELAELNSFIEGAVAIGLSPAAIWRKYLAPEIWIRIKPSLFYLFFSVLVSESFYAFIGVGARPSYPTLGALLFKGWKYFYMAPHLFGLPVLIILVTSILVTILSRPIARLRT